jgi:DNA-binding XRE family transcriptional regulator
MRVANPVDRVAAAENELSPRGLRQSLGLSRERMARLLDVSTRTIERWEERAEIPSSTTSRARLARLRQLTDLGLAVYGPVAFQRFVSLPMPLFGGRTALQLIELGDTERVYGALAADYEGQGF